LEKVALDIENLCKIYPKNFKALDQVSLKVNAGDFYALLGPNGAGKSTLIGIISSLVNKSNGKVEILGIDIDKNHSLAKQKMGIVGQEVNFNQFETVYQILTQQAGYFGLDKKIVKTNSEYYLKALDLWDKRNEQGRNLSGGMKRRLMVAKALVNEPELLILDEPTAGVDIELRRSLWNFLKEINEKGTTIILTTHYLEEAEKLCKNISIIDQGKIVKTSSMKSLLKELESEIYVFEMKQTVPHDLKLDNLKINKIDEMTISVTVGKSKGIDEVLKIFQSNNIEINSIHNETNRLEELFLKLTNQI
jgi:ABC-2 type transport system ATP-binding protein|tara:strand:+ start:2693 stop:3610 length:918 start_codon:yes stop_codon:yes gene_type:complete